MWTPGPIKVQAPKLLVNVASMQSSAGPSSQWGICGCGEWHLKTNRWVRNIDEIKHFMQESLQSVEMCSVQSGCKILVNNGKQTQFICLLNHPLTSSGNCCLDKGVQLLVTTDGQLQVTWGNTLHLQVFGGIARQLKYLRTTFTVSTHLHEQQHRTCAQTGGSAYFSSEVLKDSSTIHSCCGSYTTVAGCASLQVPVDTTHWELRDNR